MSMRKHFPIILIVVLAVVALAGGIALSALGVIGPKAAGQTTELEETTYSRSVKGSGTAVVPVAGEVTATQAGTVADVSVRVGSRVAAGDVICTLSNDGVGAGAESAKARLAEAQEQASSARSTADTAKSASDAAKAAYDAVKASKASQAVVSKCAASVQATSQAAQAAETAAAAVESRVQEAQAAYDAARQAADSLTITAPAAGTVTSLAVEAGGSVNPSSSAVIATISNYDAAYVTVSLKESADAVATGTLCKLTVDGVTFDAQIGEVKPTARGCDVTIPLSNPATTIPDGATIDVEVLMPEVRGVFLVEASCARLEGDMAHAWVQTVADDGTKGTVMVDVIAVNDDGTYVIASPDLSGGMKLDAGYAS